MAEDKKKKDKNLKDKNTKVIEGIEEVNEETNEKEVEIENTKEVEKIEDIETNVKVESEEVEEKIEVESKKILSGDFIDESKRNKKNIVTIILIFIILILFTILIIVLNENRKEEKKKNVDKDITDVILNEEEKKKMINSYGLALEGVILVSYQKNQTLLTFDEANKLVVLENDVVCSEYEIYEDGKVYLNSCSVNGKMTEYGYGVKQEPKENFDSGTMLKVYVNEITNERSLVKPSGTTNILEYTVHCDGTYENPTLLGYSDYVFYYDSEYNVQMKNFKTDTRVLQGINYTNILPFKIDNYYDTKYVAVYNGNKWGIYDLDKSKIVVGHIYDYIISNYGMGVSGPPLMIETLKGTSIVVCKNSKYGVVDYTSGVEIIPVEFDSLMRSGNYLWTTYNDRSENAIYDFSGNSYLTEGYDKVYGISAGTYVLVKQDGIMKLIQMDGKVLYEYGEDIEVGNLNFAFEYDGGPLFQFYKDMNNNMCVEFSYNVSDKTGETKEIACGGIAKPILYLYPEVETDVIVRFEHPEFLETTYPKFNNYWKVKASPNGDLYDKDNKYYYALYWDEKKIHTVDFNEGFYVEKDNAIEFLEKKLSYIGLNDKEKNEFIMYWLPILEKNGKSLVYFELTGERESYNKLLIEPEPDSMLRLVIHIKKVDEKVNIKKQSLTKFNRSGFTVVEWGGTTY